MVRFLQNKTKRELILSILVDVFLSRLYLLIVSFHGYLHTFTELFLALVLSHKIPKYGAVIQG